MTQGRLLLPDNAELRSEFTEITVTPSASDPGYAIATHGPDYQADAAVMAITETQRPRRTPPTVHALDIHDLVIPAHQKHIGAFYGSTAPEYAIGRTG